MKIQCNVCEVAEAKVLCCADEAALCWACDEEVHAANKLAGKHQRVPLSSSSSPMPKCDICQETVGYFFCLQDRALLCRKCDVAIHTANTHVSAHQRFLLTGVNVGLESAEPGASSSSGKSQSGEKILETESYSLSRIGTRTPMPLAGQRDKVLPVQVGGIGNVAPSKFPFSGGSATTPPWQFDDYLGLTGFNENYGYMDKGSSKILDFFPQAINGKVACTILSMERSKAPTVHSKVTYFVKLDSAILAILDVWVEKSTALGVLDLNFMLWVSIDFQADSGKLGESDCSPILRAGEEELEGGEYLGQVPDASWLVPQVPSPPTTSGLHWPKDYRNLSDAPVFVPDICYSPVQNPGHYQPSGNSSKRRRGF